MKIYTGFEQGSADWMIARAGVVTASEMDAIITPLWKARTGDGVQTYLNRKLAEKWLGGPLPSVQGVFDMEQGNILEEEARPAFTIVTGLEVSTVAFITDDTGRVGCSPDGLVGDDAGLEIKCPRIETHIGYLRSGELPKDYAAQVHGSLYVTGRQKWHFMSYRRGLPPLILTVERDESIMAKIDDAVTTFLASMADEYQRLVEINGGEPKRHVSKFTPKPDERVDINN